MHYGSALDGWFQLRYELAFANHNGTTAQLVTGLQDHLAQLDASRPVVAPAAAVGPPATSPARWASDPYQRHQLRYWDGHAWTEHVSDAGLESLDPCEASPEHP